MVLTHHHDAEKIHSFYSAMGPHITSCGAVGPRPRPDQMGLGLTEGFHKWRSPQSSSIYRWYCPLETFNNHPAIGGTSIDGTPQLLFLNCSPTINRMNNTVQSVSIQFTVWNHMKCIELFFHVVLRRKMAHLGNQQAKTKADVGHHLG